MDVQLQQNQATILFKVFQSAMANIAQHSKATEVRVILDAVEDKLIFEIADDGVGFKFDDLLVMRSNGLMLMRESVLLLEGQFDMETAPGQGTMIRISIPYGVKNVRDDLQQIVLFDSTSMN